MIPAILFAAGTALVGLMLASKGLYDQADSELKVRQAEEEARKAKEEADHHATQLFVLMEHVHHLQAKSSEIEEVAQIAHGLAREASGDVQGIAKHLRATKDKLNTLLSEKKENDNEHA